MANKKGYTCASQRSLCEYHPFSVALLRDIHLL